MNPKSGTIALLATGSVSRSSVGRLSRLIDQLGPIKAASYRVASRIANALRSGSPVHDVADFADSPMVLISVPDRVVSNAVREFEQSSLEWTNRTLVICDTPRDSSICGRLIERGARVATFNLIAGLAVMEGNRTAIREFKRLLLPDSVRVVRLESGGKPLLFAGLTLAGFTAQLAAAASDCLRSAGIEPAQARKMVHNLMAESLRSHTKSGHKALDGVWNEPELSSMRLQHAALRKTQPDLANYFAAAISAANQFTLGLAATNHSTDPAV